MDYVRRLQEEAYVTWTMYVGFKYVDYRRKHRRDMDHVRCVGIEYVDYGKKHTGR